MAKTEIDPYLEKANKLLEGYRNPPKKENAMDGMEETMQYYNLDIAPDLYTLKVRADQSNPRSLEMFNDAITSMKGYLDNGKGKTPDDLIGFGKEFADYLKVGISRADDTIEELAQRFVDKKMEEGGGTKALPASSYKVLAKPKQGKTFMEIMASGLIANSENPTVETNPKELYRKAAIQSLLGVVGPYINNTNQTLKNAASFGRKVLLQPVTDELGNNIFDKVTRSLEEWDTVPMDGGGALWKDKGDFDEYVLEAIKNKRAKIKYATGFRIGESIDNALEVEITPKEKNSNPLLKENEYGFGMANKSYRDEEEKPRTYLLYPKNSTNKLPGTDAYWLDQILSKPESFIAGEKASLYQMQQEPLLKWAYNKLYEKKPVKQRDETGKVVSLFSEQMIPLSTKSGTNVPIYMRAIQDVETNIISGYQIFNDDGGKLFDSAEEEEKKNKGEDYMTLEDRLIEEKDGKRRTEKGILKILREAIYNK